MIERAATWLKPGGTLVYSVCSLEPEEGEKVARAFADRREDMSLVEERRLTPLTWLEQGGADSFYIARFVRG